MDEVSQEVEVDMSFSIRTNCANCGKDIQWRPTGSGTLEEIINYFLSLREELFYCSECQ